MDTQFFTDQAGRDLRWTIFLQTNLGQLYQAIPFSSLEQLFPQASLKGRPALMGVQGGIGLQILKSYLGLSDEKLIARLNSDWVLQYFCGIRLQPGEWIKDKDYVGRWRRYLSKHIDYNEFQQTLAQYWSRYMNNTHVVVMDATCYESHLRYPTDVKLLWESCERIWKQIDLRCEELSIKKIRRKQKHIGKAFNGYQKYRRKPKKETRKIKRRLLGLLSKGLRQWDDLVFKYGVLLKEKIYHQIQTIRQIYDQQKARFDDPDFKIKDRIVSISKPYIRPIVRGKEIKKTEFGAKVHSFQIDGITFVEHLSFDAFNEATRLQSTVELSENYFGVCKQLGADQIYANNGNRKFCTRRGIHTSFVRKGPKPKIPTQQDQLRSVLANIRASHMEGAFGNEKSNYNLDKIKARNQATEKLWIHFGIWTASAMKIAKRINAIKTLPKVA